jgi:hypothetical protein
MLALYLLEVLPWTHADWRRFSPGYVIWIRGCWTASLALAAASLVVSLVRRRVRSWVSQVLVAGFASFALFTLALLFERYSLW